MGKSNDGKKTGEGRGKKAENGKSLIGLEEAIHLLKTTRPTFYRWLRAGQVKGMKVGRKWRFYRDDIERFLSGQGPRIDLPAGFADFVKALLDRAKGLGLKASGEIKDVDEAVGLMMRLTKLLKASSLHLASHVKGQGKKPTGVLRYRVDGALQTVAEFDSRLLPVIVAGWKKMGADVRETPRPQYSRVMISEDEGETTLDFRLTFLPTALGESFTARVLDPKASLLTLDAIDYASRDKERLARWLQAPWGMILICGPAGCGKTTILYAALASLARPELKVMTVEDPVEIVLPWATQMVINEEAGMTFPVAGRAIMNSDPDVVMINELRSLEMVNHAMMMALTGRLVLSTLHTNDAASTLIRMTRMGADPAVVADATKLIVAQRLARRVCPDCSVPAQPEGARNERAAALARTGGLAWDSLKRNFRRAVGCVKCGQTGYRGRTVVAETLEVTPEIWTALRDGAAVEELTRIAVSQGMTTMAADGIRRAASGETTLDEVMRTLGV